MKYLVWFEGFRLLIVHILFKPACDNFIKFDSFCSLVSNERLTCGTKHYVVGNNIKIVNQLTIKFT